MGLTATELLMRCEEDFGIEIDGYFSDIRTVGDLYWHILQRVSLAPQRVKCDTLWAFLELRRILTPFLRRSGCSIRPDSSLKELVSPRRLRACWNTLIHDAPFYLPRMERPRWYRILVEVWSLLIWPVFLGAALTAMEPTSVFNVGFTLAWVSLSGIIVGAPILLVLRFVARPKPPVDIANIRDILRQEARPNRTPAEIWGRLRLSIAEILDVPPAKVTLEADLLDDLGWE